jgi:hypothetical protein
MNKALVFLKDVFINHNFRRFWLYVNKTPMQRMMAGFRRLIFRNIEKQRAQQFQNYASLNEDIRSACEKLKTDGYVNIDNLFSERDLLEIDKYVQSKKEQTEEIKKNQIPTKKDFWIRLSDNEKNELTTENPFIKISLKENILSLVGLYFGQIPLLEYALLTLSQPSKPPYKVSQLWHLDKDNDRMLKMFIYFTDVLENGDGPFTFFSKEDSKKIKNSFAMKHLEDHLVYSMVDSKKIIQIKGRKWTAFLCDTSKCYHMGSRLDEGHERIMLTSLYVALPSVYPNGGKTKIKKIGQMSKLQEISITGI